MSSDLKPCPFCSIDDSFVERSDFSSSYVTCNNCSARGPIECQDGDDEDEPGADAAKRGWNTRPDEIERLRAENARLHKLAKANNNLARHSERDRVRLMAENARLRDALEQPWSWPCPEGGAHCCCDCDECCDCYRPRTIEPDWQNAETCIENVMDGYVTNSVSDDYGPVDTVVDSGDLFVILSLAGAAFRARDVINASTYQEVE